MSFRARLPSARDGKAKASAARLSTSRSTGVSSTGRSDRPSILRPLLAGMISAAAVLYACGWDSTRRGFPRTGAVESSRGYHKTDVHSSNSGGVRTASDRADKSSVGSSWEGGGRANPLDVNAVANNDFSDDAVRVVVNAVESYAAWARRTLEVDELGVQQGQPLQGKYIVLDSGNELANRLRGVLSGFFLGVLTERVFVADITYQKDVTEGLLSALFEGPGYEWDLSKLAPELRRALAPSKSKTPSRNGKVRGGTGGSGSATLVFDMSKNHFHRWTCDDVLEGVAAQVVTLSTVVYPLPLLARNPMYASHPIFAATAAAALGGRGGKGERAGTLPNQAGAGQRGIEALETLLTRIVLRPKRELRNRAKELAERVREKAAQWGRERERERGGEILATGGLPPPVRVVGIHARTYFVKAVSTDTLERNLQHFEDCAVAGGGGHAAGDTFFFVATDEAQTQAVAQKVWGEGCYFEPFGLPGSKLEGIKAALVDLLVMGSFDDYVMTPHSSFSELGAMLSHTWLPDPQAALRALPNRPIVPLFPRMNDFERQKVLSLLDRRAAEVVPIAAGGAAGVAAGGDGAECMRVHAAGMSVVVAKGRELLSMFEAIEGAPCMKGKGAGVADL